MNNQKRIQYSNVFVHNCILNYRNGEKTYFIRDLNFNHYVDEKDELYHLFYNNLLSRPSIMLKPV